jgi:hypothetical protein
MDVYEALYQAFTSPTVQPARRTFGKVEYAFIPVPVIEGVLADALYDEEDDADVPDDPVEDEVLATVEPVAEESFDPPTGAGDDSPVTLTAAEVAVVEEPTDPEAVIDPPADDDEPGPDAVVGDPGDEADESTEV